MTLNIRRVIAFLLLIALSVGFGFAFDATATLIEKQRHPQPTEYRTLVTDYATQYAIPEAVVWATMRQGSGFASNAVSENREIGLMQLTPVQFTFISEELLGNGKSDQGLLYDPKTNLEAGCAYLSYLYGHYSVWDLTFAAYRLGSETVDAWLTDPRYINEQGILISIPDPSVAEYVERMEKTVALYTELYYTT